MNNNGYLSLLRRRGGEGDVLTRKEVVTIVRAKLVLNYQSTHIKGDVINCLRFISV